VFGAPGRDVAVTEIALLGKYKPAGASVAFTYDGKHVSLDPKPPLLGLHTAAELLAHDPAYARNAAEYHPGPTAIATLRAATAPVTVRVLFGSWCPYCKLHVPNMLRVEEELAGSNVTIEYFGLPSPPAAWKGRPYSRQRPRSIQRPRRQSGADSCRPVGGTRSTGDSNC